MNKIINVILSGGVGKRLWPLSRKDNPKQFIQIFNGKSLFQHTLERNLKVADDFLLVTNKSQLVLAEKQVQESNAELNHKIIEPVGRNTAPAIALAALSVSKDTFLFITPSDHMIGDFEEYQKSVSEAVKLAKENYIVTFGIKPSKPETGYGYIEHQGNDVISFREKPNKSTAEDFLAKGTFLWNSGMFCFKASTFLDELKKIQPEMYALCLVAYNNSSNGKIKLKDMEAIPDDSIDYAILEKTNRIKMVKSNFNWSDLGSFDSLIDFSNNSKKYNLFEPIITNIENNNSFAFTTKKVFSTKNLKDIILIETEDSILLLEKGESEIIKEVHTVVTEKYNELT